MAAKKQPKKPRKNAKAPRQPFAELPPALQIRNVGRPSKYDPSFCDLVRELGSAGKSKHQIAAALGITVETLAEWRKAKPDFSEAINHANALALAWWENAGQMNMTRQGFNSTAYIFQMCNRFRKEYQQRVMHEGDADNPIVHRVERRIIDSGQAR